MLPVGLHRTLTPSLLPKATLEEAIALSRQGEEVWAPLPGTLIAWASNLGRGAWIQKSGYLYIAEGKASTSIHRSIFYPHQTMLAHRAVMSAFVGPPAEGQTDVRHLDGDPTNNMLYNLAYGTRSENMKDARRLALRRSVATRTTDGTVQWYGAENNRFLEDQVDRALTLVAQGEITLLAVSKIFCIPQKQVSLLFDEGKESGKWTDTCEKVRSRKRLPLPVRQQIVQMIQEGKDRKTVNDTLSLSLTAQDFYYYITAARKDKTNGNQ